MFRTLVVDSLEYNISKLEALDVWNETSGFQLSARAYNGRDALELLWENTYDMVITDIHLPIVDGLQLLKAIGKEGLCGVVVILCDTAQFQYVRECIIFGAFDYLQKMPDRKTMLELMDRARDRLMTREAEAAASDGDYPTGAEQAILDGLRGRREEALALFSDTLEALYRSAGEEEIRADMTARRLYSSLVAAVFRDNKWLYLYRTAEQYRQIDYLWSGEDYAGYFTRRLAALYHLVCDMLPAAEGSIREVCLYILNHPEADLRLKWVAEHAFLNHTYLSSRFSDKTGRRYSEYVTGVKMARAEYLLRHTDDKVYEIAGRLGYKDIDYFSRQFKSRWGESPAKYRTGSVRDWACL